MAIRSNFSQQDRLIKAGFFDNPALAGSNITHRLLDIDYEEWVKFISYYRYYIDEFAEEILGIMLFDFQKLQLRAMARNQNSMLICCRGIGKSWISAVFMVCMCILFPGYKFGIVSGKGIQARNVIIQKIDGELAKNDNLKREIQFPIHTGQESTAVYFKNGSYIRAIVLGHNMSGDSARSWRFNAILVDEARLVPDETIETVLTPMTKTNRENLIKLKTMFPKAKIVEKGKMIYISSAHLKTTDLYKRFTDHYTKMKEGHPDYFVCSLDYRVGVNASIFEEEDILQEKDKPTSTIDSWTYIHAFLVRNGYQISANLIIRG